MQRAPTGSQHCRSVYSVIKEHSLPHDAFVNMEFTFMPPGTGKQSLVGKYKATSKNLHTAGSPGVC